MFSEKIGQIIQFVLTLHPIPILESCSGILCTSLRLCGLEYLSFWEFTLHVSEINCRWKRRLDEYWSHHHEWTAKSNYRNSLLAEACSWTSNVCCCLKCLVSRVLLQFKLTILKPHLLCKMSEDLLRSTFKISIAFIQFLLSEHIMFWFFF
jgi:hypothetical protein